jgi:endonuclease-3
VIATDTRAHEIIERLKAEYPDANIVLNFSNPVELLVAVMLSAQCTDKKVNEVTATLFKKYGTVDDFANVPLEELEQDIKPTGFFRNKAKNIKGAATMLIDRFNGEVPSTMEEILKLPGVARKTANVVLGNAYGVVDGIAVDTHVKRLSNRLGLSKNDNPEKIEKDLMGIIPQSDWFKLTYLLIEHGRAVCDAKRPKCDVCVLNDICPSAFIA